MSGVAATAPMPVKGEWAMHALDFVVAASLLVLLLPVIAAIAIAIKLDSPGPVFFRCKRVGRHGSELDMLKFRKMRDDAAGPALTVVGDSRFTRVGSFLAFSKLDELPQLWHVVKGEMSLVGPRPESAEFVEAFAEEFELILSVKPGITGLSQLAFAREAEVLNPQDRVQDYMNRVLPQKVALDEKYASIASLPVNARILVWTAIAVLGRRPVAVHRSTGRLSVRHRPAEQPDEASGAALRGAG